MTFSISALPAKRSTKSSAIAFDRRWSQFATGAGKTCQLLTTMATGLPTGEWDVDLSGRHSVGGTPLPAAVVRRIMKRVACATLFFVAHIIDANLRSRAILDRLIACCVGRPQNCHLAIVRFAGFDGL